MSDTFDTQLFLVLAVAALALWPLRRVIFDCKALGVFIIAALLVTAVGVYVWTRSAQRRTASAAALKASIPHEQRESYVSSKTCQACHPSQYASWHKSYHRTMTQAATPETVIADFDDVDLEWGGATFSLSRDADQFLVKMREPVWVGRPQRAFGEIPLVYRRVVMTTGSHHMQLYWLAGQEGNLLISFPFTWLREENRWVPNDATLLKPQGPPKSDIWNSSCIKCHSVAGQPRVSIADARAHTRVAELGISCEACHGPAENHVRLNRAPWRRYQYHLGSQEDPSIVNPEHLSHTASAQVCGQCHSITQYRHSSAASTYGVTYQPGQELGDTRHIVQHPDHVSDAVTRQQVQRLADESPEFLDSHFWPDGMVRVSGREYNGLIETPCHTAGTMSCLSCHSMHNSHPDDQLAAGMKGDRACLQCHQDLADRITEHSHHQAGTPGSRCYNCHMPHTTYGLLKAIRSHKIESPSVAVSLRTGRPNACNLCHLDKSLGWTSQHLHEWYGIPHPAMSDDDKNISAAVRWLLQGDAGQRAILAWHTSWEPAWEGSGKTWIAPFLAQLLSDPYAAVRYIAVRSLRRLPGFEDFPYDYTAAKGDWQKDVTRAVEIWKHADKKSLDRTGSSVLMDTSGEVDWQAVKRLMAGRNNRAIDLRE